MKKEEKRGEQYKEERWKRKIFNTSLHNNALI